MDQNNANNSNGKDPKKKVVRIRFNLSWFYILLIAGIAWML